MRSKALLDLNVHPVHDMGTPRRLSGSGIALLPPQGVQIDPYDLPPACVPAGRVVCAYCAEAGGTVGDVRHQDWCVYADGPVCPDVPN